MIDKRLLALENFLRSTEHYKLNELAEYLEISDRQLVRQLNSWQKEGYIDYKPGKGRGNTMFIALNHDVENEMLAEIIDKIDEWKVEELRKFLDFPWKDNSIHEIQSVINHHMTRTHSVLIDYIEDIPINIHPAYIDSTSSSKICYQVYESLYQVTATGDIRRNLLSYDEWQENKLYLHLKKEVKFSNGEVLRAQHVKDSLQFLMEESAYAPIFTVIEEIEIVDENMLILHFEKRPKFFEYFLSSRYSAIYTRLKNGEVVGTGPYFVEEYTGDFVQLSYTPFYRGNYPDIEKITFKVGPANTEGDTDIFYLSHGDDFLLFNPHQKLSLSERSFLSEVFLMVLSPYVEVSEQVVQRYFSLKKAVPGFVPTFNRPLRVIVNEMNIRIFEEMKSVLALYEIELEIVLLEQATYLNTHLLTTDADFIWMYEHYQNEQPFKVIDLLTHCKFQEWYGSLKEARAFLTDHEYKPNDDPAHIASQWMRKLEQQKLLVPLFNNRRKLFVPSYMKNIREHAYGSIDYKNIIVDLTE